MARSRRAFTPEFDVTLGARPLADAREDVTSGRWQGLPPLLDATWGHWDLRTHRMRLLAQSVAGTSTDEGWHAAQPDNPDAPVLRAETEVMRVLDLAASAGGVDRHRLDQAACFGGLDVVATHLFKLVGNRATQAPWCHFGDPAALLDRWYERIMG